MFKILDHSASYQLSYSKWSQKLKTITKLEGIANERLRILIEPLLLLLQEASGSGQVTADYCISLSVAQGFEIFTFGHVAAIWHFDIKYCKYWLYNVNNQQL